MSTKKFLYKIINRTKFPYQPLSSRFPPFLFPVALPGILDDYINMIKNTLSQWKDRSHDSITDEELNALSDSEYQEYIAWRIRVNLNQMEAEGFIVKELNEDGVEVYRMLSEQELQDQVDSL